MGLVKTTIRSLSGYSEHNKLVNFTGPKELIGQIVKVKLLKLKPGP